MEISRYKKIYQEVRSLRLQKLASLSLPTADVRKSSVRSIAEIQVWKVEQQSNHIQS